jgi:hypothetical protein
MDRQNRMKLFDYRFERAKRELQDDWSPSWTRYCKWLKDRKIRENKALVEAAKRKEQQDHNDKVLRAYGLGKYQRKGYLI